MNTEVSVNIIVSFNSCLIHKTSTICTALNNVITVLLNVA